MTDEAARREVWRPSASGIERSEACELSAVLPRPPEAPKAHNAPASRGDRIHGALERYVMGARDADVKHVMLPWDCPDFDDIVVHMPKLEPINDWPQVEVEMWINPMTGECKLGTAAVPVDAGFWRGRADRIGWYEHPEHGRIPCVVDYKTGSPWAQIDGGAKQLGYFVVGCHIMLEAPRVYSIAWLTQDPTNPRGHLWDEAQITERFRGMHNHEARLQLLEARAVEPTVGPSQKNCHFCSVRSQCEFAWKKGGGDAKP